MFNIKLLIVIYVMYVCVIYVLQLENTFQKGHKLRSFNYICSTQAMENNLSYISLSKMKSSLFLLRK